MNILYVTMLILQFLKHTASKWIQTKYVLIQIHLKFPDFEKE